MYAAPRVYRETRALGLDAAVRLAAHDSHGFFATLGDLAISGTPHTNVNDFRALRLGVS